MDPFYTLQSPGSNNNYPPQRLSYYRITCPGLIQFSVQEFYLQDKIRISYNQKKCVDYVKITDLSDSSITREFCGMLAPITESYTDDVLVTFRTSKYNNYPGFTIYAYCNNSTQIMGNCLEVENSEYAAGQTIDKWTRKVREEASICDTNNFDHFCFFRVYQSMHYVNYEHFFAVESKVC